MSEIFKYQNIDKKKSKSFFLNLKRKFILILPILFFFFTVWLVFIKFDKSPIMLVEEYLQQKKYIKALPIIKEQLKEVSISQSKWLMYGSIVQFGIQELPETKETSSLKIPNYYKILKRKDTSKIFLKESYRRKLQMFSTSKNFMKILIHFKEDLNISFDELFSDSTIQLGFQSKTTWSSNLNDEEKNIWIQLFRSKNKFITARKRFINANNLNLRSESNINSKIISILKKQDKVLIRKKGPSDTIYNHTDNWYFVITEDFYQGWVFGKYLKK